MSFISHCKYVNIFLVAPLILFKLTRNIVIRKLAIPFVMNTYPAFFYMIGNCPLVFHNCLKMFLFIRPRQV